MWHTSTVTRRRALGGLAAGVVASGSFGFVGLADQHEDDDDGDDDGDDGTEASAEEEPGDDPIEEGMARVRAVHAAPDVMDVDVWVQPMDGDGDEDGEADDEEDDEEDGDGDEAPEPALSGLSYRDVSRYVAVEPGAYTVSIGEDFEEPAIELDVEVEATDYSVAVVGESATDPQRPLEALVLADDNSEVAAGMSRVRLLHASPDAPAVDVTATAIADAGMADGDGDGDEADAGDGEDGEDDENADEGVDDIGDGDAENDTEDGEDADGLGDGDATGGDGEEQTLVQGLDFGQHGYVEVPTGEYRLRVYGAGDGAGEDTDGDSADDEAEDGEADDGEDMDGEAEDGEDMDGEAEDGEDMDDEAEDGEDMDGEAEDGEDMDGDAEDGAAERGEPVLDLEVTLEDGIVYSAFAMGYLDLDQAFVNAPLEVVVTEDAGPDEYRATPPEDGTDVDDEDAEDVGEDMEDDDEASADGEDDMEDDGENGENDLLTPILG